MRHAVRECVRKGRTLGLPTKSDRGAARLNGQVGQQLQFQGDRRRSPDRAAGCRAIMAPIGKGSMQQHTPSFC